MGRPKAGTALTAPADTPDEASTVATAGDEVDGADSGAEIESRYPRRQIGGDDKVPDTSIDTKAARLEAEDRAEKRGVDAPPKPKTQKVKVVALRTGFYANERKKPGNEFVMEFKAGAAIKLPSWVVAKEDYVPPVEPEQRPSDGRHH